MSVEYLYEKKSDDDEYNEIWRALQREQSVFERILLSENKAFVIGRLFEAKYLTQKLREEKYQQLNLVKEQLERQEKAEQVNAEEEELLGRPNSVRRKTKEDRVAHQPGQAIFRSILPEDIDWKPFPAFPSSVRLAVVVGKPSEAAPYVIRVKVPAGVKLMPHRHPEDRVYTVISGVFYIGLGDQFDGDKVNAYPPGSVIVLPGNTSHFHWAKSGEYVTQVTAIGPLGIEYLDPGDDPREQNQSAGTLQAKPMMTKHTAGVEHIRIESAKSFVDVRAALERNVPQLDPTLVKALADGDVERANREKQQGPELSIFGVRDHGALLAIAGEARNALQYEIGNPVTASLMTRHRISAALYAPIRVVLYENDVGHGVFEYDQPSTTFGQFGDQRVTAVARGLDAALARSLLRATE